MGGHGNHDSHERVNLNNIQEADDQMPYKIRPIDLIKYNPNLFHMWVYDPSNILNTLGGVKFEATALAGGFFGYWYYQQKLRSQPATFYARIMHSTSRIFLGLVVGSVIAYLKFGDRQRLHNAFVAERLRRRYPEALELDTKDLWKYKGIKPRHEFYRWV